MDSSVARFALGYSYRIRNSTFGKNVASCCTRFSIALDDICVLNQEFMFNCGMCKVSRDGRDTGSSLFELLCVRDGLYELDYWTLNNNNNTRLSPQW